MSLHAKKHLCMYPGSEESQTEIRQINVDNKTD